MDKRLNQAKQKVRAALEGGNLRYWLESKLPADALEWLLDAVARQTLTPRKYRAKATDATVGPTAKDGA